MRRFWLLLLLLPLVGCLEILHLADFHMDVDYSTKGDNTKMCHAVTGGQTMDLGSYGDYMCDSPQSLVAYTLEEAHRLFPSPDAIFWTGDNIPHIDNYTWEYVFNAINITTRLILKQYANVPIILPTFGNHDYAPANAYDINSNLYKRTWGLWGNLIGVEQEKTFLLGGYYKFTLPNVTFLVLNTNLYYNANGAYDNFTDKADPAGMFSFMETELQKAASCDNRVDNSNCTSTIHVVAHIPPGVFERTPDFQWFRPEYNQRFLDITIKYANVIKWMIYGHHHTDTFHLVKDNSSKTVQLSLMSPAVTPWFSTLSGAGANNPAFRVYETTGWETINDIKTYYVNLSALNSNKSTSFEFEYSFKQAYGISGPINAEAMDRVLQQMKTNDTMFMKYITYNSVMWKPVLPQGQFRGAQLCSIEFSDYPRYDSCLQTYKTSMFTSPLPAYVLILASLLLI